jgi:cytidyltransferase-like protein
MLADTWGCVHGRFQPFHNEHLEYVLHARQRCHRLIIGITNADPTWRQIEATSTHRHRPASNPFTYFERVLMIQDTLHAQGLQLQDFVFVPFPIHDLGLSRYYVPADTVHLVRVYSPWEQEKVRRLRDEGFRLEVLDPGKEKTISGSDIRRRIRSSLPWTHLVPQGTARVVGHILVTEPDRLQAE